MSSHNFAIAKAAFSAYLLRPDPNAISRPEIQHFHDVLNAAVNVCSPPNVQSCKRWILSNIIPSAARCSAFGKFLIALSKSFSTSAKTSESLVSESPTITRKTLHLVYIVNDLLYHGKFNTQDASVPSKIQPFLVDLFTAAGSNTTKARQVRRLENVLGIWAEKGYYSEDYLKKLREAVKNATELGAHPVGQDTYKEGAVVGQETRTVPFVMPALHGDQAAPWFDLPAANFMPHIIPNSKRAINPQMIKPLQFVAGPADESLANAVRDFLLDVEKIFGNNTVVDTADESLLDIDELGQPIIRDEINGDVLDGEGYYGWSKQFCEKMKTKRHAAANAVGPERRGRSGSRSSSASGIARSFRKRRYSSDEDMSSRSRSRTRYRRRERSTSFSPPPSENTIKAGLGSGTSKQSGYGDPRGRATGHDLQGTPGSTQSPAASFVPAPMPSQIFPSFNPTFIPPPPPPPQFQGSWPPPPPPPPSGAYPQQSGQLPIWRPPPPFPPGHSWQMPTSGPQAPPPPPNGMGGWTIPQQQFTGNNGHQGYQGSASGVSSAHNGFGRGRGSSRGRGWS